MRRLFTKVIRDLLKDKFRTAVSLLAIIFGTIAFGMMTFSFYVIEREIVDVFLAINPSSANVKVDKVDDKLINLTKGFKDIGEFEEKAYYELRIKVSEDQWKTLHLFAIKDFSKMKINKLRSMDGSFNPGKNELLIERDALGVANTAINKMVTISMPDSSLREFKVAGVVHDITAHPASIENIIPVYVSYDTLADLGLQGNRVDFILADNKFDRTSILAVGNDYMKLLETNGYKVESIDVSNNPGRSIHQPEYDAVMFVLQIASILAFFLGCMIMSSLLSTILSSQIRQIGILKAIGAKTKNIFMAYMMVILALVVITVIISTPIAIVLGANFSTLMMSLGNLLPGTTSIPVLLIVLYCALSLVVPLLVAILPIRRGVKATVREALSDYGTTQAVANKSMLADWFSKFKVFSRPVVLSIRNAARRKGRFYLNVANLTLGGALFIAAVIAIMSMSYTITKDLETFVYDYQINTSNRVDDEKLAQLVNEIPEIKEYENWGSSSGKVVYSDGQVGNLYTFMAPSFDTKVYKPVLMEGRWLNENDTNEVVVGHQFYPFESEFKLGDIVTFRIGDKEQQFKIVGTIKELGSPTIFMNKSSFDQLIPDENKKNSIKLITQADIVEKESLYQKIEDKLKQNGVIIFQAESMIELLEVLESHGMLIVSFFMVIAIMILVVAGFGLTSTMSVQVAERTKEIGIMKAMGATRRQIKRIVTAESIFICFASWAVSILLGILIGTLVAVAVGNIMVNTPLDVNYLGSYVPVLIWLVLTFTLGYFASRTAAKRASKMSVKDTLAFE
ncbi:MAG: ABC transporter permease [Bacillota bacterium]